jgi:rSAM/selenodomain-associated transferase 1
MIAAADPARPTLVVFAKEPVPGRVKTRLAAAIGATDAARAYRELTAVTLAHAVAARTAGIVAAIELWCASDAEAPYFRQVAATAGAQRRVQVGDDLGARMAHAIADVLTRCPRVLLIGTDCPVLDGPVLAAAAEILDDFDAVLGPAEDGGYVLVGATRPLVFRDVRWSSPHALADTMAGFARAGLRVATTHMLWDVDEPADLARWEALRRAATPAG